MRLRREITSKSISNPRCSARFVRGEQEGGHLLSALLVDTEGDGTATAHQARGHAGRPHGHRSGGLHPRRCVNLLAPGRYGQDGQRLHVGGRRPSQGLWSREPSSRRRLHRAEDNDGQHHGAVRSDRRTSSGTAHRRAPAVAVARSYRECTDAHPNLPLFDHQRRGTPVATVRHLSRAANMLEVDARTRILEAAASLLAESPERDISTRAVCEAAGVGAPMLSRLFGDKNGLLAAVVDHRFGRYITDKRNSPPAADPVDDLYVAWDNHVAFALENPTIYRIVYSPSLAKLPAAAVEAHRLLVEWMDRCAEAGKLKLPPDVAAQTFTAACVGGTPSLLSQTAIYDDPDLSDRVRDAIIRELIVETGDSSGERDTDILKPAAE